MSFVAKMKDQQTKYVIQIKYVQMGNLLQKNMLSIFERS